MNVGMWRTSFFPLFPGEERSLTRTNVLKKVQDAGIRDMKLIFFVVQQRM